MSQNLTDQDRADLARFLRDAIEADRYPFSPRVRRLKEPLGDGRPGARAGPDAEAVGAAELHAGEEAAAMRLTA